MYFYEHTNGSIIYKADGVIDLVGPHEYFDSPFVVRWWHEKGEHIVPKNIESDKSNPFA